LLSVISSRFIEAAIGETAIQILHIIQQLSRGGAARTTVATSRYSSRIGEYRHRIISLLPSDPFTLKMAEEAGLAVLEAPAPGIIQQEVEAADIVQVEFWNSPELYAWLREDHPTMRLILRIHIAGHKPPQVVTKELIEYSDRAVGTCPFTMELPVFQNLPGAWRERKTAMVLAAPDFERLVGIKRKRHSGFNVGYIGTVDFLKMHPHYIAMSSRIRIPDVRFKVCGSGAGFAVLRRQAEQMGAAERFEFKGYVEDLRPVLESLDVFGYPLCEDNYSTSELVLGEVMYAGIPPVIFPYGGAQRTVIHNQTGLIVQTEAEYGKAIEFLYHHPEERLRLGHNARENARQCGGSEQSARQLNQIYEELVSEPKRQRRWPISEHGTKPGPGNSMDGLAASATGAVLFIQTLGGTAPQFATSLTSRDRDVLLDAEKIIGRSSPVLMGIGAGGFFHYRNHYPQDPFLRLWTGLALQSQARDALAVAEFMAALRFGLTHWRVSWYLAQSAFRLGEKELATQSLRQALEGEPAFEEAKRLLKQVDGI
jgi:glycosyltransferase involved in cell wall biosynthesis